MSTQIELWRKWEGKVVDGKLPLRQWVGGSDHSAVFLTERGEQKRAAIKLISAENLDENSRLSRWADTAKLSHPHLIRLLEWGRCQIDNTRLLYVVMEYAEENLAEIIPLRPLAPAEATEMLPVVAEALAFLHRAGYTHGGIRPSNILAVDNQLKISTDGLRKSGDRGLARLASAYEAPEAAMAGFSPASDVWSLGLTLFAVLTQNEPKLNAVEGGRLLISETIPRPLHEILRQCLQVDPQKRCTVAEILRQVGGLAPERTQSVEARTGQERVTRWMAVPVVLAAMFLIVLVVSKFSGRRQPAPAPETHHAQAVAPADNPVQSPPPFSEKEKPAPKATSPGSVRQQVMPDVSRSALNTITGKVKVSVQVDVDASGNVSEAKFVSAGPSKYFAGRALAAARSWKFDPPIVDGQAASSEWLLRFEFRSASTQVTSLRR
jgi:TonB family protein